MVKNFIIYFFCFVFSFSFSLSETINSIEITGNERVSDSTIKMFSNIKINSNYTENDLNDLLFGLYETNFFKDIQLDINNNILSINVVENPIIQTLSITGIKAKKIKEPIFASLILKEKSSFTELKVNADENRIVNYLKNIGYYFASVESSYTDIGNNLVVVKYDVDLGKKAKIKKIRFLGDKYYKESTLRNIILSEEYKFWKFISGKKFLNENIIKFDERLLINHYKNNGFYQAKVNSSFVEYLGNNNFELTYNIESGKKFFFNDIKLELPVNYQISDFTKIKEHFSNLKNKPYSFDEVEKILDKIDIISSNTKYEFIDALVDEKIIDDNKINLTFNIADSEKIYVEKINIFGNNVTQESVIRNNLIVDEGDAFNIILHNKSINELKALNFFKEVTYDTKNGSLPDKKIIDIFVEEKPTGEITAGAGVGTSGGTLAFGVRENNYLGKGVAVAANLTLSEETIRGLFSVKNPNINGSGKSLNFSVESTETDRLKNYGYKSSKTGITLGTGFEYYKNLNLNLGFNTFFEKLTTDSTASKNLQKEKGNFFDMGLTYSLDYDLRNQKYQPTAGYRSTFSQIIPLVNERNTLINSYNYKYYKQIFKDTVTKFAFYTSAANSLTGDNVKISERRFLSSSRLRGFESGKVGPKDGKDYVGGNYNYSMTLANSLTPYFLPNMENLDFGVFFDIGNNWGTDYDSSLDQSNKIRSAAGLSVDWFTPIGPLNFSISQALSKAQTDKTEFFRFNLGTTF